MKDRHIIVDDSPTICQCLEEILQRQGYGVKSFQDPQQALRALLITEQVRLPDLPIVDLLLPAITGLEVITCFRKHSCVQGEADYCSQPPRWSAGSPHGTIGWSRRLCDQTIY